MQGVEQDPLDTSDAPPGATDGASEESNDSQGNYGSGTFSSQPWQLRPLQHGQLRQEGGEASFRRLFPRPCRHRLRRSFLGPVEALGSAEQLAPPHYPLTDF